MNHSKLKKILDQHRLWVESSKRQGERADLRGADLYNTDFQNLNLNDVNFVGADLRSANFGNTSLSGANFGSANLCSANLYNADLTRANFYNANLQDTDLINANLQGANLRGANFQGANLTGANQRSSNFKDAFGLPDISWIIPGCMAQLSNLKYGFWLVKEKKSENFSQDAIGMIIQNNVKEETFDILIDDRIIRNVPSWVKYCGLKQIAV